MAMAADDDSDALARFVAGHPRLLVVTGAGCSEACGIPAYRDHDGAWKSRPPVRFHDFVSRPAARARYWARSAAGWPRVAAAAAGAAHRALAALAAGGWPLRVVTQNVDGLHQKAGSRDVVDLHGRLDRVACLACDRRLSRADVQELLLCWNPWLAEFARRAEPLPDGDARVETGFEGVRVPDCPDCGGLLKPDVVFFGENVPAPLTAQTLEFARQCDGVLVVGSSLTTWSGYRLCLAARDAGRPVAALNLGRTRADALLSAKWAADCGAVLGAAAARLTGSCRPHAGFMPGALLESRE
jgi:NAD-dependent SIR2 family protein deacetylase